MTITPVACYRHEHARTERTVEGLHTFLLDEVASRVSRNAHVLDVGCGTGAWLSRLRHAGYAYTDGIHLDHAAASLSGIDFRPVDLEHADWALSRDNFEFITAIEVIEHIGNRASFLRNIHRHLSADGLVLITTLNVHNFSSRLGFLLSDRMHHFNEYADSTHHQPLVLYPFQLLVQRGGFQIVQLQTYSPCRTSRQYARRMRYFIERFEAAISNSLQVKFF
jgi:2-polyprenyl-3-methyl-5-hydroxy-6-metoxy-1,4-benzoquinol methylase